MDLILHTEFTLSIQRHIWVIYGFNPKHGIHFINSATYMIYGSHMGHIWVIWVIYGTYRRSLYHDINISIIVQGFHGFRQAFTVAAFRLSVYLVEKRAFVFHKLRDIGILLYGVKR